MSKTILIMLAISFSMSFLLNLLFTPLLIKLSHKKNWFDSPDEDRKIHTGEISRLGGVGIVSASALSLLISLCCIAPLFKELNLSLSSLHNNPLLVFLGVSLIGIIGLLDDFTNLKARIKLIGQILASLLVMAGGVNISHFTIPFISYTINLGPWGYGFTLLWIIGITNAINLIDGLDGLSASISAMAFSTYGIIFLITGQALLALICFCILGVITAYLFYNFPPAQIFMGDAGSLFLGFLLAILPLIGFPKSGFSLYVPLVMLAIPIGDVFTAMLRRKLKGLHFFTPDREHMHHKLLDQGLKARQILSIIITLQIIGAMGAILFIHYIKTPYYTLILGPLLLNILFFWFLHCIHHKKDQ